MDSAVKRLWWLVDDGGEGGAARGQVLMLGLLSATACFGNTSVRAATDWIVYTASSLYIPVALQI